MTSTLIIYLILLILYLFVKYWFGYFSKSEHENKWIRITSKLRSKIIDLIIYFASVRIALESYENILMSATIEIYASEIHSVYNTISYSFAWLIFISWVIFIWYLIYLCYKYRHKYIPKKKHFWMEVFSGIRNYKFARIYTSGVIIKSTFYILMVLILNEILSRSIIYSILLTFQIFYWWYMVRYFLKIQLFSQIFLFINWK